MNNEDSKAIIEWLKLCFPKAFFTKSKRIKPLQLGINEDVFDFVDRYDVPPFPKKRIRAAIGYYTSSPGYLKAQKSGAMRVDLFGSPVEAVSASQAEYAASRYHAIYAKESESDENIKAETTDE